MTKKIQIMVIEENRLLHDGLQLCWTPKPNSKSSPAEGASARCAAQEHIVNVWLVDAALGRNRSQRLVESIKEAAPHSRIIMMDVQPEEEDVIDFIKRGANGFLSKDAALEDLVSTIRQVANGGDVVPSALTGTLLSHIAKQASVLRNTPMMASVRMTKREQQITDLIAEGLSNKEIAQRLNIATYTVKSHVHNILEKPRA
jgi:DNA-binding NarL/FixJ family response regulator